MNDIRAETRAATLLRRAEIIAYWAVVAPVAARLPSWLAYRIAAWRGDLSRRLWRYMEAEIGRNLRHVLGDEVGEDEARRLSREFLRFRSCEIMDLMRLRDKARALAGMVEIRGREHLDAALAEGKGAMLCTGHFGSHLSAFSLLNSMGYPINSIGQWDWRFDPAVSATQKRFWDFVFSRRVERHRRRPHLQPWPRRFNIALRTAALLRANEFVTIACDAAPLPADQPRSVVVPFLAGKATMLPGVVSIAKVTGSPVLMVFLHRSADYRHQVLEISPPILMEGDIETVFGRCTAALETAVRRNPANWNAWCETDALIRLGLVPEASPAP